MTLSAFKDYILRKLGAPVINIEIDSLQLLDCINDAVDKFVESHYDGTDITYITQAVTTDTQEYTLASTVQAVTNVLGEDSLLISDEPLLLAPFRLGDYTTDVDLASIELFKQNVQNIENYFSRDFLFDFNSTTKKLFLAVPPTKDQTLLLQVFQSSTATDIYDNLWLKKYAVALAKIQWGSNISKFSGATLPGGVQLNGEAIKADGKEDKEALEEELYDMYTDPPDFFVG